MARHGENIHKRKDGRWEARYIQGYNKDGRAQYRYLYGKSYQEVKKKKQEAMQEISLAAKIPVDLRKCTFQQMAEEWLLSKKQTVKASTYAHYVNMVENHLIAELGQDYMQEITQDKLERFLLDKLSSGRMDGNGGLSHKTVSDIKTILKLILAYAERKGFKGLSSIQLSLPTVKNKPIKTLSRQEQEKLEYFLYERSEPFHLGILISLYTGLRIGEVCALQWKDFNFEEGTLYVNKTLIRIQDIEPGAATKTKVLIEKPKTQCSCRIIPLPDFLLIYLKEKNQKQENYLLTASQNYMEPRVYLEKYKKSLKTAGIKNYTYHALRHTFATRCVENNVDIKSLSEIMGHSNVNITMQRYVHPSLELKREQINKLSSIIICGQN